MLHPRAIIWRYLQTKHPDKPRIVRLGKNLKVRVYPYDIIGKRIFIDGLFEKEECRFVTGFLEPGMIFFDIGANLGQYTLLAAQRVGPTGRVHSFEPSGRMYSELQYNVGLNNLSDNCFLNEVAVSEKEGSAQLSRYEPGAEVFGSLGNQHWANRSIVGSEEVKTITLDTYVLENHIPKIDLIKIDIEGGELPALRGAERILSQTDAPTIVLEMSDDNTVGFGYKALDMWDYLSEFGYRMYRFDRRGRVCGRAGQPVDFGHAQNLVAIKNFEK
ncbi:MAG: FkbM family methyltransferase [Sedimentisphaerales bacterium]|nr:FkbM family methyltransferase [Sedimentisphaerales bacterium]